jgi:isorenieratene synthase
MGESRVAANGPILAGKVILATDAPNTAAILDASPDMAGAVSDLYWPRGMETAVARIWFDRVPEPGPEAGIFSGDFVLDNFFWLHRLQDQYAEWHKATGGSAVEVHIYGPPELLEEPDAVLLARAIADVQSAFPELRGHLAYQVIRRNDPTHTLFGIGSAERHLGVKTPWPGLFCCGDWVRHSSPAFFLERACVTGIEAANGVLRSCGLEAWPLLDYAPPEPLAAFIERVMGGIRRTLRGRKRRR